MSFEANLSSHLAISYSNAPAASGTPATAASPAAPAADSPLGFLAALIDQLISGDTAPAPPSSDTTAIADPGLPSLLNLTLDAGSETAAPPQGADLLAKLKDQLAALQSQIDAGKSPDPELLRKLGETADGLTALLSPPHDATTTDIATSDQAAQLLATLGLIPPAAASSSSPSAETPVSALSGISSELKTLSASVAATSPDLSQKLAALTARFDAVLAASTASASASSSDPATDAIVKSLMDAKPVATSAPTAMQIAAAQVEVPKAAKSKEPEAKPAPSLATTPASADTAEPAAKLAVAPKPAADALPTDAKSKADIAVAPAASASADQTAAAQAAAATTSSGPAAPSTAKALPAAYQPVANPINMGQMAFEMVKQIHQGQSRFSIRLDPPELGRIDVKMHVDAAGNVNARLMVERSETFDLFQRDQRSLERALAQAGLDGAKTNLEFSLKQNPFAGMTGGDQRQQPGYGGSAPRFALSGGDDGSVAPSVTLYRGTASAGGVNIFV